MATSIHTICQKSIVNLEEQYNTIRPKRTSIDQSADAKICVACHH